MAPGDYTLRVIETFTVRIRLFQWMEPYRGHVRRGGVVAFEIADDAIDIEFASGWIYRFSYQKPGASRVEHMKQLARAGRGLSTFINKHVKNRFETRRYKHDSVPQ